jgi:flavin-binding protein dodecin
MTERRMTMTVARTTEIVAGSAKSFEAAFEAGVKRACKTLEQVSGAWIQDQEAIIKDGKIKEYRVRMKVTFVLKS